MQMFTGRDILVLVWLAYQLKQLQAIKILEKP